MLSLCVYAGGGQWDLLSPPEQQRLGPSCTMRQPACMWAPSHVSFTTGPPGQQASVTAAWRCTCLYACLRAFIVYVAERVCESGMVCVMSRSAHVHTVELDVLVTWKGVGCVHLHACASSDEACDGFELIRVLELWMEMDLRGKHCTCKFIFKLELLHWLILSLWVYQTFGFGLKFLKIDWWAYWPKAWSFEMHCLTLPPNIGQ